MPIWIVYWLPLVAAVIGMVFAASRHTRTPAWVNVVFAIYLALYALLYIGETYVTGGGEVPII
jgi:hypothetical protein